MKTVQVATRDAGYAEALRNELLSDGGHQVYLVEKPDMKQDGVVVVDEEIFDKLPPMREPLTERIVVIAHKGVDHLTHMWQSGVRHVVFDKDSSITAFLAVLAAELRISHN